MIEPRGWQVDACSKEKYNVEKEFLLNATPGAGKTVFSGLVGKRWIDEDVADFVIAVVPTTALKGDAQAGFLGDWCKVGIDIKTIIQEGRGVPKQYQGCVITYQQLPNMIETFKVWTRNGTRLGFVFDEIHHASEKNTWGAAVSSCHSIGSKVLGMTGTPFRGDGLRISFVRYNQEGEAVADFNYTYSNAVRDIVCREVDFLTDDGVAEYFDSNNVEQVRASQAEKKQVSKVKSTMFDKHSMWLETMITKADEKLDEYRTYDVDAGGLIVCRPGGDDSEEDKHIQSVAKIVKRVTGVMPVVITHNDRDANAKIEAYRKGSSKWICSVRKISEGVDIKRLKVLMLATVPGTELLFRQLVGRVVRQESKQQIETASVFMLKIDPITQWASDIMAEAKAGLKDKKADDLNAHQEKSQKEINESDFMPIGSTHENGGAISIHGELFTAIDIETAEQIKKDDRQLATTSITAIAHLLKKLGYQSEQTIVEKQPVELRKREIRNQINTLVRRVAIAHQIKQGADKPNFSKVWASLHKKMGVKDIQDLMDNYPIEKSLVVLDFLKQFMMNEGLENAA